MDYFVIARLVLNVSPIRDVARGPGRTRLTFTQTRDDVPFLDSDSHPDVDQYLSWVKNNSYTMLLLDGGLVQLTYDLDTRRNKIVGHRLAYMPCPYEVRSDEFAIFPPADIVEEYRGSTEVAMRSPVRFDYDPGAASANHRAAHMTVNGVDCRIACVAVMHPQSFMDFVFRNFYPRQWSMHRRFFDAATGKSLAHDATDLVHPEIPHVSWRALAAF